MIVSFTQRRGDAKEAKRKAQRDKGTKARRKAKCQGCEEKGIEAYRHKERRKLVGA